MFLYQGFCFCSHCLEVLDKLLKAFCPSKALRIMVSDQNIAARSAFVGDPVGYAGGSDVGTGGVACVGVGWVGPGFSSVIERVFFFLVCCLKTRVPRV